MLMEERTTLWAAFTRYLVDHLPSRHLATTYLVNLLSSTNFQHQHILLLVLLHSLSYKNNACSTINMSGGTPPLPPLRDRRDWNLWSSSLLAYCQVYRTNIQGAPVRFTSSENELMYLMTLGPPEALFDLMYDSLSTEIIDGLRHCGYTFPARSHPNNLLELIKKFLAPSISQRAIHVSSLVSPPFRT